MPWHGTGTDASAAVGARVGMSGSADMMPTLQQEHDSERAEARKSGQRCSGSTIWERAGPENEASAAARAA
eukprot:7869265-Pyramimonas_sp.AAC.1